MKLSKTQYLKGLQCPESLWLEKYKKNILTDENSSQETIFDVGQQVGELACKLFPNGKKIPYENTNINEKISLTQQYLQNQVKNIYEATFEYEGVLVMVDILHINDDGSLEIYEVKSSTDVKNVYLDDASIQYYVLHGLEYEVKKTNIIYINNKYVRDEVLEIKKNMNQRLISVHNALTLIFVMLLIIVGNIFLSIVFLIYQGLEVTRNLISTTIISSHFKI